MSQPSFSILLPSRNRLDLLRHAIDSILAQNEGNLEIIVTDNRVQRELSRIFANHYIGASPIYSWRYTDFGNGQLEPRAQSGDWRLYRDAGDDDALTPGFIQKISHIINALRAPGRST
ncbi:hypothetical protein BZM27_52100, partial [Paraburkholderia steynii]